MTKPYANLQPGFDTFAAWVTKTNDLLNDMSTIVMTTDGTTNGAITSGNAHVNGFFTANTLTTTDGIRGGNGSTPATLNVLSDLTINGHATSINGNVTVSNTTVFIANGSGGSAGQVLASNGTAMYWTTAASGINADAQYTFSNTISFGNSSVNVAINSTSFSGTSNNATQLNGQAAAYYTNATNLATGTVASARLGSGTANSSTVLYGNNVWAAPNTSFLPLTGGALSGTLTAQQIIEKAAISTISANGTVNVDVLTQAIQYYTTNAAANWTFNIRGNSGATLDSVLAANQSVTVAFLVTQGSTPYYANVFQIDGYSRTPKWQGGTTPTYGSANSIDSYTYTILKIAANTYTVLAAQVKYS